MCREPREPQLEELEKGASVVVGSDWHKKLDKAFDENLGKFRKYDGKNVQDLLRALRNKVGQLKYLRGYWLIITIRTETSLPRHTGFH